MGIVIAWPWLFEKILKGYAGITLFPFIFVKNKDTSESLITHEKIHIKQQLIYLVIFFYIRYLLEYCIFRIKYRTSQDAHKKSYLSISFEREAYSKANPEQWAAYIKKYELYL